MANTDGRSLGEVVRDARVVASLSLRDVAKKLDLAASYLSDIENDRRVPSEEVTRSLADFLGLNFDDLMALAGRFGQDAERYLKRTPTAGMLFRKISEYKLPDEDLKKLLDDIEKLSRKKARER